MSLWTPYADAPLDLSKVKQERLTPETTTVDYYGYQHSAAPPVLTSLPSVTPGLTPSHPGLPSASQGSTAYPGYYYQQCGVPSAQMSPVSAGSTCSSYEVAPSVRYYPTPALSPPESPHSQKNYIADAEVLSDDPDFQAFERDALRAMAEKNGGSLLGNNPRMRRAVQSSGHSSDDAYRQQRARNNHAAKQSRDRRKLREIHLALKVAYLKNEVSKLKTQVAFATCVRCHRYTAY